MGWTGGSEIFDPVCEAVAQQVDGRWMSQQAAVDVLTVLVRQLLERDWDEADESFGLVADHEYLKAAFRANGVSPRCNRGDENDRVCVLELGHSHELRHQDDRGDRWSE